MVPEYASVVLTTDAYTTQTCRLSLNRRLNLFIFFKPKLQHRFLTAALFSHFDLTTPILLTAAASPSLVDHRATTPLRGNVTLSVCNLRSNKAVLRDILEKFLPDDAHNWSSGRDKKVQWLNGSIPSGLKHLESLTYLLKNQVHVIDRTGNAQFLLWDQDCVELIGKTALQLRDEATQEKSEFGTNPAEIEALLEKKVLFRVQVKKENQSDIYSKLEK